jgi:hypothetical protein
MLRAPRKMLAHAQEVLKSFRFCGKHHGVIAALRGMPTTSLGRAAAAPVLQYFARVYKD